MSYMSELHLLLQEYPGATDCPSCGEHLALVQRRTAINQRSVAVVNGEVVVIGVNRVSDAGPTYSCASCHESWVDEQALICAATRIVL